MMRKLLATLLVFFIASIAHGAIVSSGAGTSFASAANVTSFSLSRPSGVNVDDLLFVQVTVSSTSSASISTNGWTLLEDDTSSTMRQLLFYKVAASGDTSGGSITVNVSTASRVVASMTGYRSDLGGRNVVLGASTSTTGSSATMTAPAMTATSPGRLLRFYGHRTTSVLTSGTLTTHVSARADTLVTLLTGSRAITTSGATSADTVTASSSARFVIHSVLLTESTLTKPTTCYSDGFANATTFGQNWVTTSVGTTAFTPTITSGRLRLTSNTGYISTAATLQRLFPTSNLIYVEFDYYSYPSASGADGVAVTLSDASVTPQPGGFGGSLGYAQRDGTIPGFAGGWVGIALDEYGNFSNPNEGRNGGPGFRVDSVAVRGSGSGQSGYPYLAGTAAGLNPGVDSATTTAGPGHRYRIVIDAAAPGQTYVTVDRDTGGTGSNYTNLIPTFNIESSGSQATIPANLMLSFTGSTGGSSNTHEIGDLSVCATNINTTNQVDHFEITHDGQGLTCEPESVTIRACANADCSTLMSVPVDITLNPSGGWTGGNVQTINGSATLQLRQTTAGTAGISITNSTPGTKPFSTNKCNGVNNSTCNLAFADAGFAFDVPNLLANKPSGAIRLRAVRNSGDAANSCVALFQNTTQNVSFWSTYTTPNTGTRAVELRAGSGSGAFTSIVGASPGTPLALTFNANGETTFETRYQDAGLMLLNARYTGSGTYAGLILNGSDSFVSTPAGFCVRGAPWRSAAPYNYATCTSNFASCPIVASVSNPFVLDITAAAWQIDGDTDFCTGNGTTPNYAQDSLALSSQFSLTTAQFNAPGTASNGVTSPTTVNITGGNVNLTNATESEVGVFNFVVTPPTNAYFGLTVPSGTSGPIGRFIPHHFSVTSGSNLINRSATCTTTTPAFTYLAETLDLSYQLNALNGNNQRTQNYQGIFANLLTFAQMNTVAISGTPRASLNVASLPSTSFSVAWNNGQGTVVSPVAVVHLLPPNLILKGPAPVGPYTNTAFGVLPTDADGVTTTGLSPTALGSMLPFNLDTDIPLVTPIVYDRVQIGSNTDLRYGRLRLDSVSGPANLSLSMPVTAEYWNGSAFVTNTADTNCTTINSNTAALGPYRGNLNSGETTISGSGTITNGQALSAIQLSAPGAGNEGSVDLSLNVPWPWLQFDWNGDGSVDANASATASFGTYRGSDRVIYWLETQ